MEDQVDGMRINLRKDWNQISYYDMYYKTYPNISRAILETAAEIFIYFHYNKIFSSQNLKPCPFKEYNINWSPFYDDLFMTMSADNIILTLNRLMKTDTSGKVNDIFKRTATLLALKYKDIQNMLPQKLRNSLIIEDFQFFERSEGMP